MSSRPVASIVIPTRGGAARLPLLFDCLRKQAETSWEVIVVVDGDTDNTASLLARVRDELPLTPIVFGENRGRSAALNAGFAATRGDVLIRCDDDLRPAPGYISAHVARHRGEPVGVIGLYRNIYPDTPYARAYGYTRDARFRDDAYRVPADRRWRFWCGNVSTTRDTYDRVGPYDTAFRAYGWEDIDWGYRLCKAGVPVLLAPELETDHHIAATTTEIRVRRAFASGAARSTFDAKHGAEVSGPLPLRRGWWNELIWRTANRHDLDDLADRARRADRVLDRVPRRLAEKRVAWLVESAALAGTLKPSQVRNDI